MTDKAGCTHAELVPRVVALESEQKSGEKLFDQIIKRLEAEIKNVKDNVETAFNTANLAQDKADLSIKGQFDKANEFRGSLDDMTKTFARADWVTLGLSALDKKIDAVSDALKLAQASIVLGAEKRSALNVGLGQAWGFIAAGAAVILVAYDILKGH